MKEALILTAVLAIMTAGVAVAFVIGSGKTEVAECMKWSQEADVYPGFSLARWQKSQCDFHHIIIKAPVK